MRPDPFKRVGAHCFCRCVLFRRWAIFSAVDIMFPAGRIFSSRTYCIRSECYRFGRARRRLQEMAGDMHPVYTERKKGRLCRLALCYLGYWYIACEWLFCLGATLAALALGACGAILGRAVARAVDIVVLKVVDAHGYALHGGLAHAGVVLLDDKPLAA